MCWPPLITVLVDNNRAYPQGMEVEREREERAEINYGVYLTVTGSAIICSLLLPYFTTVCVDFLQSPHVVPWNLSLVFHHKAIN